MYIGYDEGSKSIKYYNTEMRSILTSQNYLFLHAPPSLPPEDIGIVPPQVPFKREIGRGEHLKDNKLMAGIEQLPSSTGENKWDATAKSK